MVLGQTLKFCRLSPSKNCKSWQILLKYLILKTQNFQPKLETFTKLKKGIPSALVFWVIKIKKEHTINVSKKYCEEKKFWVIIDGIKKASMLN